MTLEDVFDYLRDNLRIVVNHWSNGAHYGEPASSAVQVRVLLQHPEIDEEVLIAEGTDTL